MGYGIQLEITVGGDAERVTIISEPGAGEKSSKSTALDVAPASGWSQRQFEKNFFGSVSVPGRARNNQPLYRRSCSKTCGRRVAIGLIACSRKWLSGLS